jgi:hypothetical protein
LSPQQAGTQVFGQACKLKNRTELVNSKAELAESSLWAHLIFVCHVAHQPPYRYRTFKDKSASTSGNQRASTPDRQPMSRPRQRGREEYKVLLVIFSRRDYVVDMQSFEACHVLIHRRQRPSVHSRQGKVTLRAVQTRITLDIH